MATRACPFFKISGCRAQIKDGYVTGHLLAEHKHDFAPLGAEVPGSLLLKKPVNRADGKIELRASYLCGMCLTMHSGQNYLTHISDMHLDECVLRQFYAKRGDAGASDLPHVPRFAIAYGRMAEAKRLGIPNWHTLPRPDNWAPRSRNEIDVLLQSAPALDSNAMDVFLQSAPRSPLEAARVALQQDRNATSQPRLVPSLVAAATLKWDRTAALAQEKADRKISSSQAAPPGPQSSKSTLEERLSKRKKT